MNEATLAILESHPWVRSAHSVTDRIVRVALETSVRADLFGDALDSVGDWRELYDHVYGSDTHAELAGWRSSIDGRPFGADVMEAWLELTMRRLLRLSPRRVLEIGCGTGMVAKGLRGQVDQYIGVDISPVAIDALKQSAETGETYFVAAAHELHMPELADFAPDTVVMNSVTQHFPSLAYLADVVRRSLELVRPGGRVFIGDVRDARLAMDHARWQVASRSAVADDSPEELARRLVADDEELVIDPRRLAAMVSHPATRMSMFLRPLPHDTELARYRYDMVLERSPSRPSTPTVLTWSSALRLAEQLAQVRDVGTAAGAVVLQGIPRRIGPDSGGGTLDPWEVLAELGIPDADVVGATDLDRFGLAWPADAAAWTPDGEGVGWDPLPARARQACAALLKDFLASRGVRANGLRLLVSRSVDG